MNWSDRIRSGQAKFAICRANEPSPRLIERCLKMALLTVQMLMQRYAQV